jgi:hypothetical protein
MPAAAAVERPSVEEEEEEAVGEDVAVPVNPGNVVVEELASVSLGGNCSKKSASIQPQEREKKKKKHTVKVP